MAKTVTTTENTYDAATGRLLKQVVTVEDLEADVEAEIHYDDGRTEPIRLSWFAARSRVLR